MQTSCADVGEGSEIDFNIEVDISSCESIKDKTLLTEEEFTNPCSFLKVYIYKDNIYTQYLDCVSVTAAIATNCNSISENCDWSDSCGIFEGDFPEEAQFIGYIEL